MNNPNQQSDVRSTDNESYWLEVFSPSRDSFLKARFDSPYDITDEICYQDTSSVAATTIESHTRHACLPAPKVPGDECITRDVSIAKHSTSHHAPIGIVLPPSELVDSSQTLNEALACFSSKAPVEHVITQLQPRHRVLPVSSVFTHRSPKFTAALPAPRNSDRARCIRCIVQKKKCLGNDSPCFACLRDQVYNLCLRTRLEDIQIFSKWINSAYRFVGSHLKKDIKLYNLQLYHFVSGPTLSMTVRTFIPSGPEDVLIWGKTLTGWVSLETLPLLPEFLPGRIDEYIDDCLPKCLKECKHPLVRDILKIESAGSLLSEALRVWTANQLLMKGWQSDASAECKDPQNPYYGIRPAPAIVSKELDALLEEYIARQEKALLARLQHASEKCYQHDMDESYAQYREKVYLAFLMLMSIVERDIWRLMYWPRHPQEHYQWRHPQSAQDLIKQNIAYANGLWVVARRANLASRKLSEHNCKLVTPRRILS
ncbi:uncharacterized protein F4812DRAFT_463897 [Daldinia caldariorum]|uniref:uncharacterized protein n=1 Tax=Daldinia caldariorum TaxID=326644 RepID=UPI002008AC70|nr:uncharacterized protein F4812DRAFT_463897 [Daldinia caldariorum]KAI1463205.1 hypothetical protein F4812DRAFT_463897 [Daldinia caldariorum]